MILQLTGGRFKGMKLTTSKGSVRPTLSITRESVFNILAAHFDRVSRCEAASVKAEDAKYSRSLGGDFSGLKFLDCFCGSGMMALEAFSRGFEVLAIEKNRTNVRVVKENFKKIGAQIPVIVGDALKFKTDEHFDVIYLDPPWGTDYEVIIRTMSKRLNSLNGGGVIVCEHEGEIPTCGLEVLREKKYGRTRLTVLCSNF